MSEINNLKAHNDNRVDMAVFEAFVQATANGDEEAAARLLDILAISCRMEPVTGRC